MRKAIVIPVSIAIVVLVAFATVPIVYKLLTSDGLPTASLTTGGAPATVPVDGTWDVVAGAGPNRTQIGYTFHEVLPGQDKDTSGRAEFGDDNITGQVRINDGILTEGEITVKVDAIRSDIEKRDINVRRSILHTDRYPTATFTLTKPASVANLPEDGSVGEVTVTGDLTMHGETKEVSGRLKALRTEKYVVVEGQIPFERADFNIKTPEFVASSIDEQGYLDLLVVFEQR